MPIALDLVVVKRNPYPSPSDDRNVGNPSDRQCNSECDGNKHEANNAGAALHPVGMTVLFLEPPWLR